MSVTPSVRPYSPSFSLSPTKPDLSAARRRGVRQSALPDQRKAQRTGPYAHMLLPRRNRNKGTRRLYNFPTLAGGTAPADWGAGFRGSRRHPAQSTSIRALLKPGRKVAHHSALVSVSGHADTGRRWDGRRPLARRPACDLGRPCQTAVGTASCTRPLVAGTLRKPEVTPPTPRLAPPPQAPRCAPLPLPGVAR